MLNHQTAEKLRAMRLPALANEFLRQLETPDMNALDFGERMGMLVDAEWLSRENNRITKLIKNANLRHSNACFADIDYRPTRKLEQKSVARLSNFTWVKEHKNVIITGATGTGKTWLASAFGREACLQGISAKLYRASRLMSELSLASGSGNLPKALAKLNKIEILILDDWGMNTITPAESRLLHEIFEDRIGRLSTIIAAQVPVSKWFDLFEDATAADAVLDRIVHNSYRFELHGQSLRAKPIGEVVQ